MKFKAEPVGVCLIWSIFMCMVFARLPGDPGYMVLSNGGY